MPPHTSHWGALPARQAYKEANLGVRNVFNMDLHGLMVEEAIDLLQRQLDALSRLVYPEGVLLKAITGKGMHSAGQVAQIRPAVLEFLARTPYKHFVEPGNEGTWMGNCCCCLPAWALSHSCSRATQALSWYT
jgi:hypothetical protein